MNEDVGEDDEFSHDGSEGDFGLFAVGDETFVDDGEVWVVAGGSKGCEVEADPDVAASALDVAFAGLVAAVEGKRRQASQ